MVTQATKEISRAAVVLTNKTGSDVIIDFLTLRRRDNSHASQLLIKLFLMSSQSCATITTV